MTTLKEDVEKYKKTNTIKMYYQGKWIEKTDERDITTLLHSFVKWNKKRKLQDKI